MRSIKIFFSFILIMGIIFLVNGNGITADLYVDDDGTADATGCNGPTSCYTVIQSAISAATPANPPGVPTGDTVIVCPGTYTENISMKNGVTVISAGVDTPANYTDPYGVGPVTEVFQRVLDTIIDGNGIGPVVSFDGTIPSFPYNATTTLDGFIVQNVDSADYALIGITGDDGYAVVQNCIIRDNLGTGENGGIGTRGWWGGASTYNTAPTIDNNWIHYVNGPGIGNGPYSHATITNNEIWDCNGDYAPGIGLQEDTYPTIEDNLIFENDRAGIGSSYYGLKAKGGSLDIVMKGNDIHDNGTAGIAMVRAPGDTTGTINVTVDDSSSNQNRIYQNSSAGIEIDGITNTTIENSEIDYNGGITSRPGVHTEGSFGTIIIKNNNIHHNGSAGITNEGDLSSSLIIAENEIDSNTLAGVRLKGSGNTEIIENDIDSNSTAGIRIEDGSGTIAQNDIYNNLVGIGSLIDFPLLSASPGPYTILKNKIHGNHTSAGIGIRPGDDIEPTFTIRQNRIYDQQNTSSGGGIQVVSASAPDGVTIENNLVYDNGRGGTRFGDETTVVKNNTVVGNGTAGFGGGIIYSDNEPPNVPTGDPPGTLVVRNNISTHNEKAGIRACGCDRDYNLLYANMPWNPRGYANEADCGYPNLDVSCTNQQYGGCGIDPILWPPVRELDSKNDIMADPEFVNKGADDYHLDAGVPSPAIGAGDDTKDMGCYGGDYPMHNLIDVDKSTGNTPGGGKYIMFKLGASYTVTDVRLYGSTTTNTWNVYVGTSTTDCDLGTWGTKVNTTDWNVGGASQWYEKDVTDTPGQSYIKLISTNAVSENEVFEFQYKETTRSYWRTPSVVVDGCADING
jgi:parallel beta-helix repeat protein